MLKHILGISICSKFIGSFVLVAFFTGLYGYHSITEVGKEGGHAGEKLAPLGDAAMEIKLTAANAIISGEKNEKGTFFASEAPRVPEKMSQVKQSVERFIKSAKTRYATRAAAGTGSKADQEFDSSYEAILKNLDDILDHHRSDKEKMDAVVAAGAAKFLLADNHLFFEELLSGDATVKFEDVINGMTKARTQVESMADSIGRSKTGPIISSIDTFINSACKRYENITSESAAGNEVDAAFDMEYDAFIALAD